MKSMTEEQRRTMVVQYKIDHPEQSNNAIALYFGELGFGRSTVYGILTRFAEIGEAAVQRQAGSGRPPVKVTAAIKTRIAGDAKKGLSQREISKKFELTQSYVNEILSEQGLQAYRKMKVPAVTEDQQLRQRTRVDRLYRSLLAGDVKPLVIMDDESYFTLSSSTVPGNQYYYASARGDAPDEQRLSPRKKFESRVLVWLAISERGMSQVYFCHSSSMNGEIYSKECVVRRLLPFIEKFHSDGNYLFWPDLASCHYARHVIQTFNDHDVNFVHKDLNPPCVPHLRPIENFWAILKQQVYHHNWQAGSLQQLENRIRYCLARMDFTVVQTMMGNVRSLLRRAREQKA
jgi:transposase